MKRIPMIRISVCTTLAAAALIGYGALNSELDIGFWGLLGSFPSLYYIGLVVLAASTIPPLLDTRSGWKLLLPQTIILVAALWYVPTLVGSHPGLLMAYRNLSHVQGIAAQGPEFLATSGTVYLSWMGFQMSFAAMASLFSVDLEPLLRIYPSIVQLLCLAPLYLFLRNVIGKEYPNCVWPGLWLFTMANWIGQDYFCPQSMAFFLLLVILAIATHRLFWEGKARIGLWVILLALFGCLAATHLLTSIATLCLLGTYLLVKRRRMIIIVVICAAVILLWDVTFGAHYIDLRMQHSPLVATDAGVADNSTTAGIMRRTTGSGAVLVLDPGYIIESGVLGSLSGSESHIAVVRARIAYSGLFILLAVGGCALAAYRRERRHAVILIMVLSLLPLLLLRYAGWEVIQRVYLFGLPFAAYFGSLLFSTKRWLLVGLVLLMGIGSIPFIMCRYGNQAVDHLSDDYIAGRRYVAELQETTNYKFGTLRGIDLVEGEVVLAHYSGEGRALREYFPTDHYYFAISEHDDVLHSFVYDRPDFVDTVWEWFRNSPSAVSVYRNPEFEVFKWRASGID